MAFVAVALALAPDNYRDTPAAKGGLKKILGYLKDNPVIELHHRATLLWASTKVDGLLTADQKTATVSELRKLQLPDGGWNLPALGPYPMRRDKKTAEPDGRQRRLRDRVRDVRSATGRSARRRPRP